LRPEGWTSLILRQAAKLAQPKKTGITGNLGYSFTRFFFCRILDWGGAGSGQINNSSNSL
jgi:hypothetical protein